MISEFTHSGFVYVLFEVLSHATTAIGILMKVDLKKL